MLLARLAIGWAISGFENIGIVNFRRRMDFAREFRFMPGRRLVGFWRSYAGAGLSVAQLPGRSWLGQDD